MSPLFEAALDLQLFCSAQKWPFCFIGGLAVQRWGIDRYTKDADITLLTRFIHDEEYAECLLGRFRSRIAHPLEFAQRTRVLLLIHENGVQLDVALGAFQFEERSIARGSAWRSADGAELFTCSAEDLIVHKAFAGREEKDWPDIAGILEMQGRKLDFESILQELRPLAAIKEDDEIVPRLERLFKKYQVQ